MESFIISFTFYGGDVLSKCLVFSLDVQKRRQSHDGVTDTYDAEEHSSPQLGSIRFQYDWIWSVVWRVFVSHHSTINPLTNPPINQACILFEARETRSACRLTPWDTFLFKADSRSTGQEIYRMEFRYSFPCKEEVFTGSYL